MAVGAHAGDRLSSLIDGELDRASVAGVRAHVESCPDCAAELEAIREVRRALRSMPAVDPPDRLIPALAGRPVLAPVVALPSRPQNRGTVAAASAVACIGVVLMGLGAVGQTTMAPEVGGAVERHSTTLSAMDAGGLIDVGEGRSRPEPGGTSPTTEPAVSSQGLRAPYDAPERLGGGYRLVRVFRYPHGLHLVYEHGSFGLSVFQAAGELDMAELPEGGRRIEVAGSAAWQSDAGREQVVVVGEDGRVVTFVGDEPGGAVLEAARSMPEPPPLSVLQRIQRAAGSVLESFSPLG